MAISPEKLARYSDFVDPEHRDATYDPRQGINRFMGILSPDTKGGIVAVMGQDWYWNESQLQSRVFSFLDELGLPADLWPLTLRANWSYLQLKDKRSGQIIDGSLVDLGAVVKKVEQDPFRTLYQISIAGAELVVPLVQGAMYFVVKARKYAEKQKLQGKEPPQFDSMWRIIGSVQSTTEQRRPLAVFDIIDFLVHNPGRHREKDLQDQTKISQARLANALPALGDCGVIDYFAPQKDKAGQKGNGWSAYTLVNPQDVANLTLDHTYQIIRGIRSSFFHRSYLAKTISYIEEHPDKEYEYRALAKVLGIRPDHVNEILSLLTVANILQRPELGFKGGEVQTSAEANGLTHLFHELVCTPVKEMANTLSPLPYKPWKKQEIAIYLQNYNEERSQNGTQGGAAARNLLLEILSQADGEMKMSYIVDLYNKKTGVGLKDNSFGNHFRILLGRGLVEQPKPGYYRLAKRDRRDIIPY